MTPAERVRAAVQEYRPHAKFIAVQHSSQFIDKDAALGDGFYTANLYDEMVDANMLVMKVGRVMVQNTYIASFATTCCSAGSAATDRPARCERDHLWTPPSATI